MSTQEARYAREPTRETVAEAAAWITRLHSSRRTPDVEAAFRSWLAAEEEHRRVFENMTELWDMMPAVGAGEMPRVTVWRQAHRGIWARAAVVAMACAMLTVAAYFSWPDSGYTTVIGEQRIVNLEDGTRVSMNSGTRMMVAYSDTERRIVLKEGEAFFEVAHNKQVPFVVVAGDHRVIAVGTAFSVRKERDTTAVTLVEGEVTVTPVSMPRSQSTPPSLSGRPRTTDVASSAAHGQPSTFALSPGQRLILAGAQPPHLDTPRVDAVTAWRRGEVILDETLLAEAVAELNRYDKTQIVIDDPRIAQLPVSGIYRTGDSVGFADTVSRMYALRVVREDGSIHLRPTVVETPH